MATEVKAPITGNLWKIVKNVGDDVEEHETIMVLESMKMEVSVEAPRAGKILEIRFSEEDSVLEEDVVAIIE